MRDYRGFGGVVIDLVMMGMWVWRFGVVVGGGGEGGMCD